MKNKKCEAKIIQMHQDTSQSTLMYFYEDLKETDKRLNEIHSETSMENLETSHKIERKSNYLFLICFLQNKLTMLSKIFFTFLFLLFFPLQSWSQDYLQIIKKAEQFQMTNIDSSIHYYHLAKEMAESNNDTSKMIHNYSALGDLYRQSQQIDLSIKYFQQTFDHCTTDIEKTKVLFWLGLAYEYVDLKKADSLFHEAELMAITINDPAVNLSLMSNYAGVKKNLGDFHGAIDYYLKAEKYTTSDLPKATINEKIATIFLDLNNPDRAEEYIKKAIDIAEKNNYKSRDRSIALSYAQILMEQKKYAEAQSELENAIAYYSTTERWHSISGAYNMQTNLFIHLKEWDKAVESNQKALVVFDKTTVHTKCNTLLTHCKILLHQKKYNNVITNTNQVLELTKKANLKFPKKEAHYFASVAHEKLNQDKLALQNFKKYKLLHDSLFQSQQNSLITSLESQHDRKEKENEIALLDSNNEIQTAQLSQQKSILTIGSFALAIISGLLFFLFRSFKKIKSQNQIISKSLQEKDTLLREIHHRVKNNLQLVSSLLGLQSLSIEDPKALEALNSGKSRVKSMALIHQDLYNRDNLTGISIKNYLEKLCQELISTYQVDTDKIELKTEITNIDLDVDTLVPLGLIINELITNSLKYAFPNNQSGKILIKLFEKNGQLILEVKDDGIGLDLSKKSKSSFGFKLVNTLLEQLEGEMHQEESNGTHLVFAFEEFKIAA